MSIIAETTRRPADPARTTVPDLVSPEHDGKFLAWSLDGLRIVAAGDTYEEAERLATEAGHPDAAIDRASTARRIG